MTWTKPIGAPLSSPQLQRSIQQGTQCPSKVNQGQQNLILRLLFELSVKRVPFLSYATSGMVMSVKQPRATI